MFYSHLLQERPSGAPGCFKDAVVGPETFLLLLLLTSIGQGRDFHFSIPTPQKQNKHVMLRAQVVVSLAEGFVYYCELINLRSYVKT